MHKANLLRLVFLYRIFKWATEVTMDGAPLVTTVEPEMVAGVEVKVPVVRETRLGNLLKPLQSVNTHVY